MRRALVAFFICLAFLPTANAAEKVPLFQKLVEGSPWVFITKYENTEMAFRMTPEGGLQKQSSGGEWKDMTLSEKGEISWKTINGHQISISLDEAGHPVANHSKHLSSFKSNK